MDRSQRNTDGDWSLTVFVYGVARHLWVGESISASLLLNAEWGRIDLRFVIWNGQTLTWLVAHKLVTQCMGNAATGRQFRDRDTDHRTVPFIQCDTEQIVISPD